MGDVPAWHEKAVASDADRLSDALGEADRKALYEERAGQRTRTARQEIAKLASSLTEQEACALISSLVGTIGRGPFSHTEMGVTAVEYLLDAHNALENCNG